MQMKVVNMEIGLHFLNATKMQRFRTLWGVARTGNKREEIVWLSELCIQDLPLKSYTYRPNSISGVSRSPRATMISAVASVHLWDGTTRSLAERNKWAEVTLPLWLFTWRCKTEAAKKPCLDYTIKGRGRPSWHWFQACPGLLSAAAHLGPAARGPMGSVFHKAPLLSPCLFMQSQHKQQGTYFETQSHGRYSTET